MSETPLLSVIIPTWNGRALLAACLESLGRQTLRDFETLVVDDGSTDDTVEFIRTHHPDVHVVACPVNRGFVAAINRGLEDARGRWIFLLNNDVTLAENCIEGLMEMAHAGEHNMLAPLVLWTEDPRLVYSAGDAMGRNGRPASIGYKVARDALAVDGSPFGISGGYGVFSRELLDRVGCLDPAFGAYFEDSDLSFRARWAGYRAAVCLDAVAWHVGSATIQNRLWWRTRQCYRNHTLLVIKNFSLRLLWWNAGAILRERAHQSARLFRVARNEWGAARALFFCVHAWLGLAARIPGALLKRRAIMAHRRRSSAEIQALLTDGGAHG